MPRAIIRLGWLALSGYLTLVSPSSVAGFLVQTVPQSGDGAIPVLAAPSGAIPVPRFPALDFRIDRSSGGREQPLRFETDLLELPRFFRLLARDGTPGGGLSGLAGTIRQLPEEGWSR